MEFMGFELIDLVDLVASEKRGDEIDEITSHMRRDPNDPPLKEGHYWLFVRSKDDIPRAFVAQVMAIHNGQVKMRVSIRGYAYTSDGDRVELTEGKHFTCEARHIGAFY